MRGTAAVFATAASVLVVGTAVVQGPSAAVAVLAGCALAGIALALVARSRRKGR